MSQQPDREPDEFGRLEVLEADQNVPPRPEEEIADVSKPSVEAPAEDG